MYSVLCTIWYYVVYGIPVYYIRGCETQGDLLCVGPPYFYHNIYFDWLVPSTFKSFAAPLRILSQQTVRAA